MTRRFLRGALPALLALLLAAAPALAGALDWLGRLPAPPAYRPSAAFALDGWIDHTSTWVSDSSSAGWYKDDLSLHTERLLLGAHGRLAAGGGLQYQLRAGGTLAQNSLYEQRVLTPEFESRLDWTPISRLRLGAFARYGWRRPNYFMIDSLRRRDLIAGARLALRPLEHTELSAVVGNRRLFDEHRIRDHRFLRAELEQRLPAWRNFLLRAWGESAWYGADSLDWDLQRSLAVLTLAGELPGGVLVNSRSELVHRADTDRILGENRLRWNPTEDMRLSGNAGADYTEYEERSVYRRHADAAWRWMPWGVAGFEIKAENERVERDDVDWIHRRGARAVGLLDWRSREPMAFGLRPETSAQLGGGWYQTTRYGRGWSGLGEAEIDLPAEPADWLALSLSERVRAELFHLIDRDLVAPGANLNQIDADNVLGLSTTFFPRAVLQGGLRADWRRHVGSDIVYSADTLRDTVSEEVWVKWRRSALQVSLAALNVHHVTDASPAPVEQRYSLHLRLQPWRVAALNLRGVVRPEKEGLPARMWLRAFAEFELNKLAVMADLRFYGDPEDLGDRDTQAWVHVVRRLW